MEDLDGHITKLLDLTREEWKAEWKTSEYTQLFPNLTFRLLSLDGRNQYTQEQKQRIFELGFTSFMELPWTAGGVAVGGKRTKVNEKTQLWEKIISRKVEQGTESLIRVEIGCFILQALSLKNKEGAINLIIESYDSLKEVNKITSKQGIFRDHLSRLILTGDAFRQWVQANKLDRNNGFEWDSEVPRLGFRLLPQDRRIKTSNQEVPNKLSAEFNELDLRKYPPKAIVEFVDYILKIPTEKLTNTVRSDTNVFQTNLAETIENGAFNDSPSLGELKEKLNKLNTHIRSTG